MKKLSWFDFLVRIPLLLVAAGVLGYAVYFKNYIDLMFFAAGVVFTELSLFLLWRLKVYTPEQWFEKKTRKKV